MTIARDKMEQNPHNSGVDTAHGIEKFTATELLTLRTEMLQSGIDSFQAAELVTNFLAGRGYGISNDEARDVATSVSVERLQAKLESAARSA